MKLSICFMCLLILPHYARADFYWSNTSTNRVAYADGVTPVAGETTDNTTAAFVQLIWAGPDGTRNPAVDSGDGATGDDQVHSKSWMGRSGFDPNDGFMTVFESIAGDSNGYYYVRVWTGPADDFDQGIIPTSPTNFYADSALWLNPESGTVIDPDNFDFGGPGDGNDIGFSTTSVANDDQDGDGMPDWWEFLFFTNITDIAGLETDYDMDGQRDRHEFFANTIPTDDKSLFELKAIDPSTTTNGPLIKWQSATNAFYTILRTTNILDAASLEPIATNIAATPPQNCYTDSVSAAGAYIYAISVEN